MTSSILRFVGPLCHYWGEDNDAEDAPMCRHDSCYKIVEQDDNMPTDPEQVKLTIVPIKLGRRKCQAPEQRACHEKAAFAVGYDYGHGVEVTAYYCESHCVEEQGHVELDNRNRAAGFILL